MSIADVYRPYGVVVLGVEQNADLAGGPEGPAETLAYMRQFGWDFPVVRDVYNLNTIFNSFGVERDSWVIVDADGKVAYKSSDHYTGQDFNSAYRAQIINTLTNLGVVPVRPTTWGGIKALYE